MKKVTDEKLLSQLNEGSPSDSSRRPVTDPALLDQLNADSEESVEKRKQYNENLFRPMLNTPSSALMQQGGEVGKNPAGRTALEIAGSIPFGLGEGIGAVGSRLAARNTPQIAQKIADVLGMIGKNAAFGASSGAINPNQEGSASERALQGSLWGGGAGAAGKGIGSLVERMRPSRYLRGMLPPEQLKENLDVTQGTSTGLGDVLGSPILKKTLENKLPSIYGTGANEALHKIGSEVEEKGETLLSKMLGNKSPDSVPAQLHQTLNKQYEIHQELKNALYKDAEELADKTGFEVKAPSFSKVADRFSSVVKDTPFMKDKTISDLFNKIKNFDRPDRVGRPVLGNDATLQYAVEPISLKEANLFSSKLNTLSKTYKSSPDPEQRGLSKIFSSLGGSLKSDIKDSLSKFGHEQLENEFHAAEKNYKNKFSKFLDKDVYKFIGGSGDPESMVNKFIKTSSTEDLANKLSKLSSKMKSPEDKNLLSYAYFSSRALENDGKLNPAKLGTSIDKLGKNQFKELVPDDAMRKALRDYSKLSKMNKEAQYLMLNPKTGQRNLSYLGPILSHGLGAAVGASAGQQEGGGMGSVLGAITGAAAPSVLGKYATKALTSESLRNKLINEMINKTKLPGGNSAMGFIQSLQNQLRERNQNGS